MIEIKLKAFNRDYRVCFRDNGDVVSCRVRVITPDLLISSYWRDLPTGGPGAWRSAHRWPAVVALARKKLAKKIEKLQPQMAAAGEEA
jgi:hypothetical protein